MATYCICKKKDEEGVLWISCDKCRGWYHPTCVGLKDDDIDEEKDWFCPYCTNAAGSLSQPFGQEWRRCGRTKCKNFVEGDELLCIDCKLVLVERNCNKLKRMRLDESKNASNAEADVEISSPVLKKPAHPPPKKEKEKENNTKISSPNFKQPTKKAQSTVASSRNQNPKFKVQTTFAKPRNNASNISNSKPIEKTLSASPCTTTTSSPIMRKPAKPMNIDHLLFDSPPVLDTISKRLDTIKTSDLPSRKPLEPKKNETVKHSPKTLPSPRLSDPSKNMTVEHNAPSPLPSPIPSPLPSPSLAQPYKKRELEFSSMPLKKRLRLESTSPVESTHTETSIKVELTSTTSSPSTTNANITTTTTITESSSLKTEMTPPHNNEVNSPAASKLETCILQSVHNAVDSIASQNEAVSVK